LWHRSKVHLHGGALDSIIDIVGRCSPWSIWGRADRVIAQTSGRLVPIRAWRLPGACTAALRLLKTRLSMPDRRSEMVTPTRSW
jgi:hypothetical protein